MNENMTPMENVLNNEEVGNEILENIPDVNITHLEPAEESIDVLRMIGKLSIAAGAVAGVIGIVKFVKNRKAKKMQKQEDSTVSTDDTQKESLECEVIEETE